MAFPTSPSNGDLHTEFGRTYRYVSETNSWTAATTPAPENVISTVTAFESAADLPLVNNNPGDTTFVAEDNSFRLWTGNGWFEIALANTAPTITAGANASYTLNADGTPTVITMSATDPEGTPIIWAYQVTSGSLEDTSITNVGGEFTITPGTTDATFDLTFTASDGINIDTSASSFTLAFIPDWSVATLLHTLDNPNPYGTPQNDNFGYSVAISGNYTIVGAWFEDDAGGTDSGKAYIYNVTTGALVHTLDNPNAYGTQTEDSFGYSVAISGNYAIVGAVLEDDAGGTTSGKAYIFNVTTGALVYTLDNPNAYDTSLGDVFGGRVAISGNYAIVSAPNEDDAGGTTSGKAYIFKTTTGDWSDTVLLHTLDNPNAYGTSAGDWFGSNSSIAISGNYAIVGAPSEDDAGGTESGKVYIFDVTTGALLHTLNNPNAYDTSLNDSFGNAVAIDGNYAIVGAGWEDEPEGPAGTNSGKVYIFDVTTGTLVKTLDNPNADNYAENDNFGRSVAISNGVAIIGAPYEDGGSINSGIAYIFQAG